MTTTNADEVARQMVARGIHQFAKDLRIALITDTVVPGLVLGAMAYFDFKLQWLITVATMAIIRAVIGVVGHVAYPLHIGLGYLSVWGPHRSQAD